VAGYALETQTPDGLSSAVVAGNVFMPYILIDVVGQLEEGSFILTANALGTEIVVGSHLGFVAFLTVLEWVFTLVAF
jgi:hypothetical protein